MIVAEIEGSAIPLSKSPLHMISPNSPAPILMQHFPKSKCCFNDIQI
jgi:hypothetical protein